MTMLKKILLTILIVTLLLVPAYANSSILDPHVQNLNSAGADYVSGKITQDELLCKVIETEYLMRIDKGILDLLASGDVSWINNMYEVTTDISDGKRMEKNLRDENMATQAEVLRTVLIYKEEPEEIVLYYNLQGDRPVVVYLTIVEDYVRLQDMYKTKFFHVDMYPSLYERETYPYFRETNPYSERRFSEPCLKKYLSTEVLEILENATQFVYFATESGIDTSRAEEYLKSARNNFENGNYGDTRRNANRAMEMVEASKRLSEFRNLNVDEKTRFIQEMHSGKKEMTIITANLSDDEILLADGIGSNLQINMYAGNESNSIISGTIIFDIQNKTRTNYDDQLVGEYDFYVGIDLALVDEIVLMEEAEQSYFNIGKRLGIGIITGEIKIRPFWKLYTLISLVSSVARNEEKELVEGVISELS